MSPISSAGAPRRSATTWRRCTRTASSRPPGTRRRHASSRIPSCAKRRWPCSRRGAPSSSTTKPPSVSNAPAPTSARAACRNWPTTPLRRCRSDRSARPCATARPPPRRPRPTSPTRTPPRLYRQTLAAAAQRPASVSGGTRRVAGRPGRGRRHARPTRRRRVRRRSTAFDWRASSGAPICVRAPPARSVRPSCRCSPAPSTSSASSCSKRRCG